MVMVNCGATIDVVELLQPEETVCFYICDRSVDADSILEDWTLIHALPCMAFLSFIAASII